MTAVKRYLCFFGDELSSICAGAEATGNGAPEADYPPYPSTSFQSDHFYTILKSPEIFRPPPRDARPGGSIDKSLWLVQLHRYRLWRSSPARLRSRKIDLTAAPGWR
jgi:hypothetical protein